MSAQAGRLGIGIIGAGHVGPVLGAALRTAGHAVVGVHAVSEASRERAELLLPDVPLLEIPEILRRAEAVLFAVPDDALPDLVSGLAAAGHIRAGSLLVHTSVRYGVDVFTPAREAGAIPLAIHPVFSFSGTSMDVARLNGARYGVSADPIMLPVAQALVVEMGGEPVVIAEEDRELYAAALDLVNDPLGVFAGQAWEALSSIGIEDPSALMAPGLRAAVENALMSGPSAGVSAARLREPGRVRSAMRAWARPEAPGGVAGAAGSHVGGDSHGAGRVLSEGGASYAAVVRAATQRALRRGEISGARAAEVLEALGE